MLKCVFEFFMVVKYVLLIVMLLLSLGLRLFFMFKILLWKFFILVIWWIRLLNIIDCYFFYVRMFDYCNILNKIIG